MSFVARVDIPPEPRAIGAARRFVRTELDRWDAPIDREVVLLLVSELVTNAIRHARPPLELHLRWEEPVLRAAVVDADVDALPQLARAAVDDEGGRGLYLVDRLAHAWGSEVGATTKQVWFELVG